MTKKRSMTLPFGLLIPGAIGTYSTIKDIMAARKAGGGREALRHVGLRFAGYDINNKKWDLTEAHFTIGWVSGAAIHKGVGGFMGVNRALGAAKVPIFRV